jgi:hypothetical protein
LVSSASGNASTTGGSREVNVAVKELLSHSIYHFPTARSLLQGANWATKIMQLRGWLPPLPTASDCDFGDNPREKKYARRAIAISGFDDRRWSFWSSDSHSALNWSSSAGRDHRADARFVNKPGWACDPRIARPFIFRVDAAINLM